jgi:fatty acid desaturase
MNEKIRINWYRTNVDKPVMSDLMRKSDARALDQVIPQLALFAVTGTLAFFAYRNINATNWAWEVPLLLVALFVHGTFAVFFGGTATHELCRKTPFKTAFWNEFFLNVYAFLSWLDPVAYRVSHVKHHQVTVHHDHDGEVELPLGLDWHGVKFVFWQLSPVIHPMAPYNLVRKWIKIARGDLSEGSWAFTPEWTAKILPEENLKLRREHRNWARTLLIGHLLLAILFVATGN